MGLLCRGRAAEDGRRRALRECEAELDCGLLSKRLLDDAERLGVIVCLIKCRHLLVELRDDGRGRDVLERLLGLTAEVAARRRAPALRLEVLLRGDGEGEPLLTLGTAQGLCLQLGGAAGDAALRLTPVLLLVEGLVGGRELELGLALQAWEHEAGSLALLAASVAARRLRQAVLQEEGRLRLLEKEGCAAVAARQLLAGLLRRIRECLARGLLKLLGSRLLCGGSLSRLPLGNLGAADLRGLKLRAQALELDLELGRHSAGRNLLLVRLDELLDGKGHFGGARGTYLAAAQRLQFFPA